jgi:hypothetical protein
LGLAFVFFVAGGVTVTVYQEHGLVVFEGRLHYHEDGRAVHHRGHDQDFVALFGAGFCACEFFGVFYFCYLYGEACIGDGLFSSQCEIDVDCVEVDVGDVDFVFDFVYFDVDDHEGEVDLFGAGGRL